MVKSDKNVTTFNPFYNTFCDNATSELTKNKFRNQFVLCAK